MAAKSAGREMYAEWPASIVKTWSQGVAATMTCWEAGVTD